MSLLVRWQAMAALADPRALAASGALSRMTIVTLAASSPPAGSGLGADFVRGLTKPAALTASALGAAAAAAAVGVQAGPLLLAQVVLLLAARAWFVRRLGGVNGDCLGAVSVVSEMISLVLLACPSCI
jgi:adenosylcobinamide-GDP ribazoletransferase